jgi:SAM-dependent methyltransferase
LAEGYKIPWNDPEFSARMLGEHLSQSHDMASRRLEKIDRQVAWIHEAVLGGVPGHVLDLGCGPGLYGARLAALGHAYTGIDFSPASIEYAQCRATLVGDAGCVFALGDVRQADFAALDAGRGPYDLAMLIFGEFNAFTRADVADILRRLYVVLRPGGRLLLEPHPFAYVRQSGEAGATWYTSRGGLFSPEPYVMLEECFWDAASATATRRHYVIDPANGSVATYAQCMQAYTSDDYVAVLAAAGFDEVTFYPSLLGEEDPDQAHLLAIVAQRA